MVAEKSKTYCVYMLLCRDQSIYTGMTNNLEQRIAQHNAGKGARYTATRRPVTLLAVWQCESRSEAARLEMKFKGMTKEKKLAAVQDQNRKVSGTSEPYR